MVELFTPFKPLAKPLRSPKFAFGGTFPANQPREEEVTKVVSPSTKFKPFSGESWLLCSRQIYSSIANKHIKRHTRSTEAIHKLPYTLKRGKFLHAIIICHFPVSARALAVARPSPEEAPVIITFPFLNVLFTSCGACLISETDAVWALTAPTENGTSERPVFFRTKVPAGYTSLWMEILGEKETACRAMRRK
uniref:Uncharacterized protein n=1 Tax=Cucumis melo TaxID=3656 RepID=A0A9I9ELI7_CUCME